MDYKKLLHATGLSPEFKNEIITESPEESQVTIHFTIYGSQPGLYVRIWNSIELFPKGFIFPSKLIHAENISFYPQWTPIPEGGKLEFTLIFSGLPKECKYFDLIESIPEPGGFVFRNIERNNMDVYHLVME